MKNYLWNMFAVIQNGQLVKKAYVLHSRKKICESVLNFLWEEGYISGYKIIKSNPQKLKIFLKYINGFPVINRFKLISKPSCRMYYSLKQIWKIDSSKFCLIISTNAGLKSITDCKKLKIGGEPLVVIS